jgi:type II restriction enzyme
MNELYTFTSEERSLLKTISEAYYMSPVLARINNIFNDLTPDKYPDAFDCLHDIILDANTEVQKILERRKLDGLIADIKQASKAVVGNIFPYSLIYIFLKNKEIKNIDRHIYITNKKSSIRGFDEISTIQLGDGERQKPDCDLIIYSYGKNLEEDKCRGTTNIQESYPKCIILSLKTSLRERAAQTYKWKLLLEIASDSGSKIREKYGITYNISEIPLIRFVTINF